MQQFCTYGSVRGASGQPASLPRQTSQLLNRKLVFGPWPRTGVASSVLFGSRKDKQRSSAPVAVVPGRPIKPRPNQCVPFVRRI